MICGTIGGTTNIRINWKASNPLVHIYFGSIAHETVLAPLVDNILTQWYVFVKLNCEVNRGAGSELILARAPML